MTEILRPAPHENEISWPPHGVWRRRAGLMLPTAKELKGLHGHSVCRWCLTPTNTRRYAWCSMEHERAFLVMSQWAGVRQYVMHRDVSCRLCGSETPRPVTLNRKGSSGWVEPYTETVYQWEVDHIIRVVDGGTDHPDNLRLLCKSCHISVTREQNRRAA